MKNKQKQMIDDLYRPATTEEIERWTAEVFGGLDGNSAVASIARLVRAIADEPDFSERDRLAVEIANRMYGLTVDHSKARDTFIAINLPPARPTLPAVHC